MDTLLVVLLTVLHVHMGTQTSQKAAKICLEGWSVSASSDDLSCDDDAKILISSIAFHNATRHGNTNCTEWEDVGTFNDTSLNEFFFICTIESSCSFTTRGAKGAMWFANVSYTCVIQDESFVGLCTDTERQITSVAHIVYTQDNYLGTCSCTVQDSTSAVIHYYRPYHDYTSHSHCSPNTILSINNERFTCNSTVFEDQSEYNRIIPVGNDSMTNITLTLYPMENPTHLWISLEVKGNGTISCGRHPVHEMTTPSKSTDAILISSTSTETTSIDPSTSIFSTMVSPTTVSSSFTTSSTAKTSTTSTASMGSPTITEAAINMTTRSPEVSASVSVAAIVGGVTGALLLFIVVTIVFYIWWRRRKSPAKVEKDNDTGLRNSNIATSTKDPSRPESYYSKISDNPLIERRHENKVYGMSPDDIITGSSNNMEMKTPVTQVTETIDDDDYSHLTNALKPGTGGDKYSHMNINAVKSATNEQVKAAENNANYSHLNGIKSKPPKSTTQVHSVDNYSHAKVNGKPDKLDASKSDFTVGYYAHIGKGTITEKCNQNDRHVNEDSKEYSHIVLNPDQRTNRQEEEDNEYSHITKNKGNTATNTSNVRNGPNGYSFATPTTGTPQTTPTGQYSYVTIDKHFPTNEDPTNGNGEPTVSKQPQLTRQNINTHEEDYSHLNKHKTNGLKTHTLVDDYSHVAITAKVNATEDNEYYNTLDVHDADYDHLEKI